MRVHGWYTSPITKLREDFYVDVDDGLVACVRHDPAQLEHLVATLMDRELFTRINFDWEMPNP